MRRHSLFFAAAAAVGALVVPIAARAECFTPEPVPHVIDAAIQGSDRAAPTLPFPAVSVSRGQASSDDQGCGGGEPACDAYGVIRVSGVASDDRTPMGKIGYRFTLAAGTLPAGLVLPADPVDLPPGEPAFAFLWTDGPTGQQAPVDFALRVEAVDAAGNVSTPLTVPVRDAGSPPVPQYWDGNCRISTSRMPARGVVFMASLLVMAIVRRRRVRS